MMPSSKHGDPQLGIDIHLCIVPPSPSPVPLPTPHMSVVFDPFDYVPIIGATVSVFGMKRATAGTGAIVVHIPPGFPFAPMLPDKDDELFMGSASVLADGDPLSYLALPVLGCQVAGMPSPPRPKKKRIPLPNLLPTTFNLAIPTTVRVGGPPTISMMGMAAKGAFAGLGKLGKSKFAKNLGDRFKQFRQKLFKNMDPGFLKCKVLRAEPVNILTGEVVVEQVDFSLQGRIPIHWLRTYSSNRQRRGACGYGWESPADARLEFDPTEGCVVFHHPIDGPALFPHRPAAQGSEASVLELMDGALLTESVDEYRVRSKSNLTYHFPKQLLRAGESGTVEYPLGRTTDLCGNWLEYVWVDGQLDCIRESSGRQIMVDQRDGLIRRLWLSAPARETSYSFVEYDYDEENLAAARDALGNPYRFVYEQHHLVRHTNRAGLSFYYEYETVDNGRRVVHAWGDGQLYDYRFVYWPEIRETRVTDSLGHVCVVKCDERGLPVLEIDPLGRRTIFEYDEVGRTVAVVNPANRRTEYSYDERGNLHKLRRPDGAVISIECDRNNRPTRITDPMGAVWLQHWDERGLLSEQRSPLGAVTRFQYGDTGLPVARIHAEGASTRFAFDVNGYLITVIDAANNVTRLKRDELGNVLARTDALGRTTCYDYDAKSRLVEVRLPLGHSVRYDYDAEDRLIQHQDENGACTRYEYVGLGLVSRKVLPNGGSVEYLYDTEEQLVGLTDQRGETYQLERDALGRVINEIDYWGQRWSYEFDAAGWLCRSTDPAGRVISIESDLLGRVRRRTFTSQEPGIPGFSETFDFDANGNLIRCGNQHAEVVRRFDAEGRMVEEWQGEFKVSNAFDAAGNRLSRFSSTGNMVRYSYDALGRPATVRMNDEAPLTIDRDASGQIVKESFGESLERRYRHDLHGRLVANGVMRGQDRLFATQYEYDGLGNITCRQDTLDGVSTYRYDPLSQIYEHVDPQDKLRRFLYDPAGARLSTRVTTQPMSPTADSQQGAGEWKREGECEGSYYQFDRAGNLRLRRDADGAAPQHELAGYSRYEWDANQRLVRSEVNGVETIYAYDPLGRRVWKQTGDQRVRFYWDGDTLLGEDRTSPGRNTGVVGSQDTKESSRSELNKKGPDQWAGTEYVHYPRSFVPLAMVRAQGSSRQVFYYHVDPNGCPVKLMTSGGDVVWAARYDAWGGVDRLIVGDVPNPIRLQGQYHDDETGLHYNRYRYYDSHLGQFCSRDPIGLLGGSNLYRYGPNTLAWVDVLGLAGCRPEYLDSLSDDHRKIMEGVLDRAAAGSVRKRHGHFENLDDTIDVMTNPTEVFVSMGNRERLIFHDGENVVFVGTKGAEKGWVVTDYGPRGSAQRAAVGADPGTPRGGVVGRDDILNGTIPSASGTLPPARSVWKAEP
ncbi:DUF6531 domain-containing protein [Aquabacterium sp. A7-Y]|uniref:RHS repeat-associated core domain-containing protein n=1 Tax=Aquabacterium sp. A7-Y TaxID=1349605 RepID=UPI00223D26AE|nr:RHS repeat-associated core domain-containing protein [Aquabacterium sp. A7-Y]MCW7539338.1 DUF6531 domain-containing protein [Aquabacterium sp. A7-Y]